jgi:hypothetical protein
MNISIVLRVSCLLALHPSPAIAADGPGKAVRFDETHGELVVKHSPVLEATEMTIEFWARVDGPQSEHAQFVRKLAHWEKPGWLFAASQSGYGCVQWRWWDQSLKTLPDSILSTWYRDQWHHYAAVYGAGKVSLIIDGVEVAAREVKQLAAGEKPPALAFDPEAQLRIGAEGFKGEIDELRIWKIARTPVQIKGRLVSHAQG